MGDQPINDAPHRLIADVEFGDEVFVGAAADDRRGRRERRLRIGAGALVDLARS